MTRYRVMSGYEVLRVIDPYTIAILIVLREKEMNLSELLRNVSDIATMSMVTLANRVKILLKYGFIKVAERRKSAFTEEKKYQLTPKGRIVVDAFLKVL